MKSTTQQTLFKGKTHNALRCEDLGLIGSFLLSLESILFFLYFQLKHKIIESSQDVDSHFAVDFLQCHFLKAEQTWFHSLIIPLLLWDNCRK